MDQPAIQPEVAAEVGHHEDQQDRGVGLKNHRQSSERPSRDPEIPGHPGIRSILLFLSSVPRRTRHKSSVDQRMEMKCVGVIHRVIAHEFASVHRK